MSDDTDRIRRSLEAAGVAGSSDFGHFVNDTRYRSPSSFDERAAMPVLVALLPTLSDVSAVEATTVHLGRSWARPTAFEPLHDAFLVWAPQNQLLGWTIGDALASTATIKQLDTLLELSFDESLGTSRQMIVDSLWRFKKDSRVEDALLRLVMDRDVSLHAMSALRRSVGNSEAIKHLMLLRDASNDQGIRKQAQKAIDKSEAALAKSNRGHAHHGLGHKMS
jgi:hypothetical protein